MLIVDRDPRSFVSYLPFMSISITCAAGECLGRYSYIYVALARGVAKFLFYI